MLPPYILVMLLDRLVQALRLLRRGMRVSLKIQCGRWEVKWQLSCRCRK